MSTSPCQRRSCPRHRMRWVRSRLSLLALRLHVVDEGAQGRRQVTAAGVVEEGAGEGLPPWHEHRLKRAAGELRREPVLEQVDNAAACGRGIDRQIDATTDAHDQRAARVELDDLL